MKFEFLCRRCHRHQLFFAPPPAAPRCAHGRRWSLRSQTMLRI